MPGSGIITTIYDMVHDASGLSLKELLSVLATDCLMTKVVHKGAG